MASREPHEDPDDLWEELLRGPAGQGGSLEQFADRLIKEQLMVRLPTLVARRVPVRGLTGGPVSGVGRLRLADSTTLLVRSARPGDVARLGRALLGKGAVTVTGWESTPEALTLTLSGPPGRPLVLEVLGHDQPD